MKKQEKFVISGVFYTKREAKQEAERLRRSGHHARVAKTSDGWTAYKGDYSLRTILSSR